MSLAMDSSIKLDFLTGSLQLRAEEIDPETWTQLVFRVVERCKPYLKYFPNQIPIKDLLNCVLSGFDRRVTPVEVVVYPKSITADTKCFSLADFGNEYVANEKLQGGRYIESPGWKYFTEKKLLLSIKGKLLLWFARYTPDARYYHGEVPHFTAESSVFSVLSRLEVIKLIEAKPDQGLQIVRALRDIVDQDVKVRQGRLESMEALSRKLHGITERIDN